MHNEDHRSHRRRGAGAAQRTIFMIMGLKKWVRIAQLNLLISDDDDDE
jgi:hypothetical protein